MPVVVYLGVDLALVLALVVALGFLYVYRGTFKPFLIGFAVLLEVVKVGGFGHYARPFGPVASFLRHSADKIDEGISAVARGAERGVAFLGEQIAQQIRWLGDLLGDLAETIEHRFHRLLLLFPPAAMLWAVVRAVQVLPQLWGLAHTAAHKAAAAYTAVVESGSWVRGRLARTEREIANQAKRIKSLARRLSRTGALALVATALAGLGLGWIRCPRVGRLGKRACSMDLDLLESLIADTLIIGSSISLVQLIHELQAVTPEVVGTIDRFSRVR
jgi:hypothetical protein